MRFYLASSFKLINKVEKVAKVLEGWGHTITEKWWKRPYQVKGLGLIQTADLKKLYDNLSSKEFYAKPETKFSFEADFKGVLNADVFILVADDTPRKYNGANIELGIALASKKLCLSVGVLENCVLYYPVRRFKDIYELMNCIFSDVKEK